MELDKPQSLLEIYLTRKGIKVDINTKKFCRYRTCSNDLQEVSNFSVFPKVKYIERWDDWITNCIYVCDLLVLDMNYSNEIIEKEIVINQQEHLRTFDTLKQFLVLQEPSITIKPDLKKAQKDTFLEQFRLNLTAWRENIFWLIVWHRVSRIGFSDDWTLFTFNNWVLNLTDGTFENWDYKLINDNSISITYCPEEVEAISLEEAFRDCIDIEKYISAEKTISALTVWYLVCGIFRQEYRKLKNEFPFLGFEGYSGIGKTSLLNFLSWICWYNRNSISWTCDTDYAFEVQMNSLWNYFVFIDEMQKISTKLQKNIQAAYNSGENHKGWRNWNWQEIQTFRKECSIITAWEVLPNQEEALLNRFIICNPQQPFTLKWQLSDNDEYIKYMLLSEKEPANLNSLSTDEIKFMAQKYYRPRFMKILKDKNLINFKYYHDMATKYVDKYSDDWTDARLKNNLVCALTGYLILRQANVDEAEVEEIIKDYFSKLQTYRKRTILSGVIVNYITENISEFSSWIWRVKWNSQPGPMIRIKYSEKEQGLIMQLTNIVSYCKNKVEATLSTNHLKQQLAQLIWLKGLLQSGQVKFAKGNDNISWTFIPLSVVKDNEALRKIRDTTLAYQHSHVEELRHILEGEDRHDVVPTSSKQAIQKVMPEEKLKKLCEELEYTNEHAQFFDKNFEEKDEESKPF